ncbi:MAG: aspartyl/glutamyl-tRNA amidotransferase subunit A [Solobacterium sp.]|jgi:aspartyl-tRNA(Asn)/glutamyl-tRNA(Gln) amidotransferase subunit A|nr:aspartyl/glutamyl-tRNA amidotransferase subunit A [Solobacterium sp.]MCH4222858.1 aspartyl/glutamyl-tRNA amidotransferase subunit A [Solobacterium sp.]MCH4265443.1 aspartyl/glutamyl-tRNA amidotransferase subunit A [Solobacterium sp.]
MSVIEEMVKDRDSAVKRCEEAYAEAEKLQDTLHDVITFVDPKEQLEHLPENGLMRGVPIGIKDNVNTKGILTTAGSAILANYVPIYNAAIVDKLKDAGAVCIAKTSMDELAMGGTNLTCFKGPAYNPWDVKRMTGGSSGGSAAMVAAGTVAMAIGSDTGDSVRKPAAFCGVVGVKPTYGRISRYGVVPYASSLDHVGYFTRSVKDACISLQVLAGRDDRDMTSSYRPVPDYLAELNSDLHGKKIAVIGNVVENLGNQDTLKMFNDLMDQLKSRGAEVDVYQFDEDLMKAILPTYYLIANCEATSNDSNLDGVRFGMRQDGADMKEIMTNTRTKGFGPLIRRRFVIGSYGLFQENQERLFRKAQKVRRLVVDAMMECFKSYDCLIAPASGDIAPLIDEKQDQDQLSEDYLVAENYMAMGNFSGCPSMTVPMGFEQGCPLGVNLTCRAFEESTMFGIARAIEEITGYEDLHAEVK